MALNKKIFNATALRRFMWLWPPFLGAGVKVAEAAEDGSRFVIEHRPNFLTRNAVKTAFGGTLMSMIDPFFMLSSMMQLGGGYYVWDTAAEVQFLKPGHGRIRVVVEVTEEDLKVIREKTADGSKYLHWFEAEAVDESRTVIARHRRQVYYRLKKR
ncbi:DUF4442 domain-containing protein [Corynebacterium frankenforstense]|uniref:DUF4442 domain-containing protein n=1 Tax=Corynebacterium frankenforstense TaxID=1230998 RepID=UPI0026EBBEEC|nr:DUF4442 domain-containing protein [Corynebacterium frankenforstense]